MSQQITTSFVDQFNANVFHLSQQKGSKLRGTVRNESQSSESQFWDRIGAQSASIVAGRHSDTVLTDTPHSRRMVTLVDYAVADMVDSEDKLRTLNDPLNDYVVAFMWALGRSIDDVIIAALGGSAYGGQKGTTAVPLPNAQMLAANTGAGAFSNLNVRTLKQVRRLFDDADVADEERFIVCAPSQIESLLGQTEVTSADYNQVKALVNGDVDTFMGFKFQKITRLGTNSSGLNFNVTTGAYDAGGSTVAGFRNCYAYHRSGALLAVGNNPSSSIDKRPDKNNGMQALAKMSVGATRIEEVKVVQIICKES